MNIKSNLLPENIRRCMPKEVRKEAGALTLVEVFDKEARREETKTHNKFIDWCNLNEVSFVHSRTDRKSTIQPGHPDFTLLVNGRGCCIEFKAPGGKLSQDQADVITTLSKRKVPCLVTSDLAAAISFAVVSLGIPYCEYPRA
jgi:hypothetical protein